MLIQQGNGHRMRSEPDALAEPLFDIPVESVSDRYEIMRHGGGGEFGHVTCGVLRFDHVAARRLIELLPPLLAIDACQDEGDGWLQSTLRLIAREVGMSRSALSARFTTLVGESAMRYLTRWRMQLAHQSLQHQPEPLTSLATRLGYQTESAFCRAFKREWGLPPGQVTRTNGTWRTPGPWPNDLRTTHARRTPGSPQGAWVPPCVRLPTGCSGSPTPPRARPPEGVEDAYRPRAASSEAPEGVYQEI